MLIPTAFAIDAAIAGGVPPVLWLPSVSSTITRGNVDKSRCFFASSRPAAMFVFPLALYPLSAASSAAELLTIAGLVNVLADVLKDTTQADEPSFSIANKVRVNDLTPPTADDIEPLPSSTKHASTRVVHFSIGGIGGGGGDGGGGGGDGGGGGGEG